MLKLAKMQIPASVVESDSHIVVFVWRQLGFAFFGALTSVGALFYFYNKKMPKIKKNYDIYK